MTGDQISLSAMASGSGPFTYQWQFNGANIAGATNATFYTSAATVANAGTYSVIIGGATGLQTNQVGDVTILATTNTLYGIAYGLSQYIAVGENGAIAGSSNLVAWSARSSGTTNQLKGVAFGTNLFVAVGAKGTVLTSTNGTNWVIRSSGNTNDLKGVAYGANVFVAVGGGGTTITSSDGISWTTRTFDYPRLEAITYADNLFVTVGTGGTIWTSANGINWSSRSSGTSMALNSASFGNGKFVAVGTGGLVLSSSDGISWLPQISGTTQTFESALFFNSTYFALGPIGKNSISADVIRWDDSDAGTFDQLYGSTVGNGVGVAVGKNGTILRIPYLLIDHFAWTGVSSPQRVDQSFAVTITAKDAANNSVTSFNGTVSLSAVATQTGNSTNILGNIAPLFSYPTSGTASNTAGYSFTPNTDLLVTHVRNYEGRIVAVWKDSGELLASVNVTNAPGVWVSTPLTAPLILKAGQTYVVGGYSEGKVYYRNDGSRTFSDGTINQGLIITNAAFPNGTWCAYWPLVDLTYTVQRGQSNTVTPATATFANGVAAVNVSLASAGENLVLTAADSAGHNGSSTPFNVYATNDLAVTVAASPNPAAFQSNLTYTITVMNAGASPATSVNVTNTLAGNVSFVSANSTQGTCQYANGKVTCSVGTLGNQTTATITVVVTPTTAGVILTNAVTVAKSEAESNLTNNTATIATYVPPTLSITGGSTTEGNVGIKSALLPITLSSPSVLAISFTANSVDGTALAGSDYVSINGTYSISPGTTSVSLPVGIQGDTAVEPNETFSVKLTNPINATIANNQATVTIINDDGLNNSVNSFVWNTVPSPQRTNQPFSATITAKDISNNTATTFNTTNILRGINIGGPTSKTLLTNDVHSSSDNLGVFTLGYEFTPSTDMFVTHVRNCFGTKVSLWNSGGYLLASTDVSSVPGKWVETELPKPIYLKAGTQYRTAVFSGGDIYYWRTDAERIFANGTIDQSYYSGGDSFPTNQDSARWYMVDLRYSLPATMSPTNTGNFTNGVWSGNLSIQELGAMFVLMADDGDGHVGFANRFGVYQTNDLAVTMTNSPVTALVGSNLTYSISLLNAGPNSSTGVLVTNTLPSDATFISAVSSQGTCTVTNGLVTCNLGTLGNLSSATITITVLPTIAGLPLTNSVSVIRNEADANLSNNAAMSVIIPSYALSLLLQGAADYSGSTWRSGGNVLWLSETNVTHDAIDAAQSGSIINSQQSWIETTVRGPGTLSFWWKVSSQAGGDGLYFYANSVLQTNISGNVDWQQKIYLVPSGLFVLRWSYIKDASISSGSDTGWLDQFTYSVPPFSLNSPAYTNGQFFVTLNGTNGQRLITQGSSDFMQWLSFTTNTLTSTSLNLTITPPTNATYRFYRAVHRNE